MSNALSWAWSGIDLILNSGPLLTFCLFGVLGVLPDIDHPISFYLLPGLSGRFLHTPLFILSGCVLIGLFAYFGRLLIWMVLNQ